MRNDVLQNYLDQFLKCLAENFNNMKFQDGSKVVIFLHYGPKLYMYKIQDFPNLEFFMPFPFK